MKNIFILCLCAGSLMAEGTQDDSLNLLSLELPKEQALTLEPSEDLAQEQIDSFFEIDEVNADLFLPETTAQSSFEQAPNLENKTALTDIPNFLEDKSLLNEEDFLDLTSTTPPSNDSGIILGGEDNVTKAEATGLENENAPSEQQTSEITIDFGKVFAGSPTIYSFLILLSVGSFFIWLYTTMSLRTSRLLPKEALKILREKLVAKSYPEAIGLCESQDSLLFKMVGSGLSYREKGPNIMMEAVSSEGKRMTGSHWQKIGLLNDIAIIAPMLGLLGTVLGMFYAFYDVNRSVESISTFFDGLGISVGTTVCGLLVAILAMVFHSLTKYKLVKQLHLIENEAKTLTHLIDSKE